MTHVRNDELAVVRFEGRNRTETKRKALSYWIENQEQLQLSLREFLGACTASADGSHISFRMPAKPSAPKFTRLVRAFFR